MEYKRLTTQSQVTGTPTLKTLCESCGESGCAEICEDYQDICCNGCPVQEAFERLSDYEDSGISPEKVNELAKAKADGRLVVLPIPIGGEYYIIRWNKLVSGPLHVYEWNALSLAEQFRKTVFLTREDAEKVLKERCE